MPEQTTQTFANHTRWDPLFHFFAFPVFGLTVFVAIWGLIQNPSFMTAWMVLVAMAAVIALFKVRTYALKAQDRVIRLEERLRLAMLLPESSHGKIALLREGQMVALRFASDAEVPALVEKTLAGNWKGGEIKKAIVNWRPDNFRV